MTSVEKPETIFVPSAVTDPAEYQRALLELAADGDPLATFAGTPAAVGKLCADLPVAALSRPPEPGEWSIAEVIGHLLDVDIVYGFRWRLVLTEDDPAYPGYDERRWASLPRLPFWQMFNVWEGLRASNVVLLRSLTQENLARSGVHGEQGPETVDVMVRKVAGHDIAHVNQIERAAWTVRDTA